MLIKCDGDSWNFIDENDIFVGYDTSSSCCEYADWFIADEPTPYNDKLVGIHARGFDVEGYVFDILIDTKVEVPPGSNLDEGGIVAFRMIHAEKPPLYLHLFNSHNGYYGHSVLTNIYKADISL